MSKKENKFKLNFSSTALRVLESRYLAKKRNGKLETPLEMFERVAKNIAEAESLYNGSEELAYKTFLDLMTSLDFLPNSPTLMNAGLPLQQLSACFVLPVGDSMDSIFEAIKNAALIHKSGGGTGFSFSRLRPKNDSVRATGGVASGPVSFIKVFDAATEVIKQGGKRRGANMGILSVSHPDIMEFIMAKDKEGEISNFNLSVAATDEFMEAVLKNKKYSLINPRTNKVVKKVKAREIFEKIANQAWKNGDPGVIFIDTINKFNPTPHVGEIESTNPCITKDAWIMTDDGPRQVKELINKSFIAVVNGKKWISDGGFFKTGRKPVYKLKTFEGFELRLTSDHLVKKIKKLTRYKIETEWVEAGKLKIGDRIVLNNHRNFEGWKGKYGEEEGYLIGLLLGDGTIKKDKVVLSSWGNLGTAEVRNVAYSYINSFPHRRDFKGWMFVKGRNEFRISTSYLKKIALELGLSHKCKTITPEIEKCSSEFYKGFLRGLFDADGSVQGSQKKGISIRLSQSDLEVLKAVQRMLLRMGIFSRIYENRRKEGRRKFPDGKGSLKEYNVKPQHELVISKDNILRFYKLIGFSDTKKMLKLRELLSNYRRNLNKEIFVARVKEFILDGEEDVYDVKIPGINSFDANGFLIHNCGEQPLLPYESCNLGSINLSNMVEDRKINWEKLEKRVKEAVWFLDNVIDMNNYPIPEIKEKTLSNRKIGLGVMGWADMLIKLNIRYDSNEALNLAQKLMKFISEKGIEKSVELAEKRGVFPNWKGSIWEKKNIKMRNATITTIAPTGSISIIAGVSSGIEPLFALGYVRKISIGEFEELHPLFEKIAKEKGFYSKELASDIIKKGSIKDIKIIPDDVKKVFVTAGDISYEWHIKIQAAFQKFTHNAVSKTINLPESATVEDVKKSYILAYKLGCKGITIYRDKSREVQVLSAGERKQREKLTPRERPLYTKGATVRVKTGCGNMYVTINEDEFGLSEVFAQLGKAGGCPASQTEAIARLVSLCLRSGVEVNSILKELRGIRCPSPFRMREGLVLSCPDAIGIAIETYLDEIKKENKENKENKSGELQIPQKNNKKFSNSNDKNPLICPECGSTMVMGEGCNLCPVCGFSKCL